MTFFSDSFSESSFSTDSFLFSSIAVTPVESIFIFSEMVYSGLDSGNIISNIFDIQNEPVIIPQSINDPNFITQNFDTLVHRRGTFN